MKWEDLTGKKFNMLTVASFAGFKIKPRKNRADEKVKIWNCICDCGKETKIPIEEPNLIRYKTQSCGCLIISHLKEQHKKAVKLDQAFYNIYNRYRHSAKENNRNFSLTQEEFRKITSSNCFYCGCSPTKISRAISGIYMWNGIDRIDSSKDYTLDNCNPCCQICNIAKRNMPLEKFQLWIYQAFYHMKNTNQFD